MAFQDMVKFIPVGSKGEARITHQTVTKAESEFTRIRAMMHPEEYVPEGTYCQLHVGGKLMMSDTKMERRTNQLVDLVANGKVLIAGLGIGMIILPMLDRRSVTEIMVIEKSQDVIDLVSPHLKALPGSKKLNIICADIFEWAPPKGVLWDVIYFDIWPTVSFDTLKEMEKLHRKFGRRRNPDGGWMDSWQKDELLNRRSSGCLR